jgi:hypothetical protein
MNASHVTHVDTHKQSYNSSTFLQSTTPCILIIHKENKNGLTIRKNITAIK